MVACVCEGTVKMQSHVQVQVQVHVQEQVQVLLPGIPPWRQPYLELAWLITGYPLNILFFF